MATLLEHKSGPVYLLHGFDSRRLQAETSYLGSVMMKVVKTPSSDSKRRVPL